VNERAREVVGLMNKLLDRARKITAEHKRIMKDFEELQRELDQINLDEEKKRKRAVN
jgi:hypothetical protein